MGRIQTEEDSMQNKKEVKTWNFWKYCATCHKVFGSNDINEFLTMITNHKCEQVEKR